MNDSAITCDEIIEEETKAGTTNLNEKYATRLFLFYGIALA